MKTTNSIKNKIAIKNSLEFQRKMRLVIGEYYRQVVSEVARLGVVEGKARGMACHH